MSNTIPTDEPTPARYLWRWRGVTFDFYRLCEILSITHHAQAHALKKIIRAGRSIKTIEQDIDETIASLLRWKQMLEEDKNAESSRSFECDECGHKWEWPSRDRFSPSGENCPRCGEWLFPCGSREDASLPVDSSGNLMVAWNALPNVLDQQS